MGAVGGSVDSLDDEGGEGVELLLHGDVEEVRVVGQFGVVLFVVGPFAECAVVQKREDAHEGVVGFADVDVDGGGLFVSAFWESSHYLAAYIWVCGHDLCGWGECHEGCLGAAVLLPFFTIPTCEILPSYYDVRVRNDVVCLDSCLLRICHFGGCHDV